MLSVVEVVSIADYERAKAREMDDVVDSAVDQLETMSRSGCEVPTMLHLMLNFGQLEMTDDDTEQLKFDFSLPPTCTAWPGPHFGRISLHNVIAKPPKASSKNPKHPTQRAHGKHCTRQRTWTPPRHTTNSVAPKSVTSVASCTPPRHLLTLPPEIRNACWTLLAVQKGPIEAQLRHIRPCKKPQKLQSQTIRRFPREPVIAAVNKQLRREVLSIFYGTNHFVMEKNACSLFNSLSMTNPAAVQKWNPRPDLANFLSSIDIRYNVMPRPYSMSSVIYMLRRLANGVVTVDVKIERWTGKKTAEPVDACLCKEVEVIDAVREAYQGKDTDLAEMSLAVMKKRLLLMFGNPSTDKSNNYHPSDMTCARCKKDTLEIVYSGL